MRGSLFAACVLAAAVWTLAAPREARAFERQWHAGADAGYSALILPSGPTLHGFGGGLHLTYGMSDTINLLILADVTVHPAIEYKAKPVDGVIMGGGAIGLGYVFDVLQWVPYVGAAVGGYYAASPMKSGPRLALEVPFGLDYQVSRSFAVGVSGQYGLFLLDVEGISQRFTAMLRGEYVWGF